MGNTSFVSKRQVEVQLAQTLTTTLHLSHALDQIDSHFTMADRYPALQDFSAGKLAPIQCHKTLPSRLSFRRRYLMHQLKEPATLDSGIATDHSINKEAANGGDFLSREKALLGEDAEQFVTADDPSKASAALGGGDDDLLSGGEDAFPASASHQQGLSNFESSFPAIDTANEVRL